MLDTELWMNIRNFFIVTTEIPEYFRTVMGDCHGDGSADSAQQGYNELLAKVIISPLCC